jgi:hypothetical protein
MKVTAQTAAACFGIGAVHQAVNIFYELPSSQWTVDAAATGQRPVVSHRNSIRNAQPHPSLRRAESSTSTASLHHHSGCHTSFNCIGLSQAECAKLIDDDLEDCPLDFDLVVKPSRSMGAYEETYNFVGIPLNILGEVVGFHNNGAVKYSAFLWEGISEAEPRNLDDVDCAGMDAHSCCVKVKAAVPDQDIHGQNIECFFLVLPPEPVFLTTASGTEYLQYHTWMQTSQGYEYAAIESDEVKALNDDARLQLENRVASIHKLLKSNSEVSYSDLAEIASTMSYETRTCGSSQYLSQMLDNHLVAPIGEENPTVPLKGKIRSHLYSIKLAILRCLSGHTVGGHHTAATGRGFISIHTTADGVVVNDPKVEGPTN